VKDKKKVLCGKPDVAALQVCIHDAKELLGVEGMMDMQSHVLSVAVALFRYRCGRGRAGGDGGVVA